MLALAGLVLLPAGARSQTAPVAQIAPASVGAGASETGIAEANPGVSDAAGSHGATPPSGPYAGPTRPRRRTQRAAAEMRAEQRYVVRAAPAAPRDLADVNAWLDYKARAHVLALPVEARLFYRQGMLLNQEGKRDDGERWVRAAAELDPTFADPHLTIALWSLPNRPSQALVHWAAVLEMSRDSFLIQAGLAANALFLTFQSVVIALLIAGMFILILRLPELTHPWRERLGGFLRDETARWWALSFAVLPFFAGFGVVLPTIAFLGLLWPVLRARERAIFVLAAAGVAVIPWTAGTLDRLASPLDAERPPLHGVALLENEPWSAARQQRIASLSAKDPGNPFLHFALAWGARLGGDLATAEREYRSALERWEGDDRVLTNLGNVLAMQGRTDDALELYERAINAHPSNPAPHFNESQIYTQRYEYAPATAALSRASALDFDLVRDYQSLGTNDGVFALVDQWIAPHRFWLALRDAPAPVSFAASIPPSWRGRIETSGWRFSLIVVILALIAPVAGMLGHGALPLRACSNCGRVVCRRCAQRRREVAMCRGCAGLETRAQNPDFARVLLRRNQRQADKLRHGIRTVIAALVPGFGLIAFRRAITPILLITVSVMLVGPWAGVAPPFELEARVGLSDRLPPMALRLALGVLIYVVSIAGYLSSASRARRTSAALAASAPESDRGQRRPPARAA